jgi:UDP-N-acetylmuramate--alanine ligase
MPGLAQALVQQGMSVSGSGPSARDPSGWLRRAEVTLRADPGTRRLPPGTRLLVYPPEVGREHPARLSATRRGVAQTTPSDWLRRAVRGRVGVAVAGGRQAGVTAAMVGWVLTRAGYDPTVLLEHPSPQLGGWTRTGLGQTVVAAWTDRAEALGSVAPALVVWLDPDDGSTDGSAAERLEPLRQALAAMPDPAFVLAASPSGSGGSGLSRRLMPWGRLEWLSLSPAGDWWAADLREKQGRFRFRVFHRGLFVTEMALRVPGSRHVLSALAAVAACVRLGVETRAVRDGLEDFAGLARDFEPRGSFRGVTLIDDSSDDPGSIGSVLALARRALGRRRLWAVLSAPGASGLGEVDRLAAALAEADRVLITGDCGDGDGEGRTPGRGSATAWAAGLTAAGVPALGAADLAGAVAELDRLLEPGDVLLTLGAGDVGTIADAFIRRLSRDRPGR